jgi:hypothetical protein
MRQPFRFAFKVPRLFLINLIIIPHRLIQRRPVLIRTQFAYVSHCSHP